MSLNKASGKWEARIREAGKNHYLGSYGNEIAAAHAFDDAAVLMRGAAAVCNFPQGIPGVQARALCSLHLFATSGPCTGAASPLAAHSLKRPSLFRHAPAA